LVTHIAMAFASAIKCDIEKFDGRMNFGLCQTQVKDVLIQYGLHMVLKGKPSDMKEEEWEEFDLRAANAIRLCLAKNVLTNVQKNVNDKGTLGESGRLISSKGHIKSIVIEGKVS